MKFEDTIPAGLLDSVSAILSETQDKLDPKKLDPDLDGIPANTIHKEHEGKLAAQPCELDPAAIEAKLVEEKVSGEESMLKPKEAEVTQKAHRVAAEPCQLHPDVMEKKLDEAAPEGKEEWIKANRQAFMEQYGEDGEKVLYAVAWAMKNKEIKEAALVVPAEKSKQDPDHAESLMKEDDEDDEDHGKEASGKVPNLDGIARESVEMVKEEAEKYLDPQTGEVANRAKPPKGAHLVMERSPNASGLRIQLEWANGKAIIVPPASEAPLTSFADVIRYINEKFGAHPDWIEAIEKSLVE